MQNYGEMIKAAVKDHLFFGKSRLLCKETYSKRILYWNKIFGQEQFMNERNDLQNEPDPIEKPDVPDSPRPTSPQPAPDVPEPYPVKDPPIPDTEPVPNPKPVPPFPEPIPGAPPNVVF